MMTGLVVALVWMYALGAFLTGCVLKSELEACGEALDRWVFAALVVLWPASLTVAILQAAWEGKKA